MLSRIAIHGVPRSGTTWIGEIFNSSPHTIYKYQPLFSYAFKDFLTPSSSPEDIETFYTLLADTQDDFLDQTEARARGDLPTFAKAAATHLVYKEVRYHHIVSNLARRGCSTHLVLVIRNPLSVISSWLLAPREFRSDLGWVAEDEWRYALKKNLNRAEEFNGYERWKDTARLFIHLATEYPDTVTLIEYRSLIQSTEAEIMRVFSRCGLTLHDNTLGFLASSRSADNSSPYSVFRGSLDDLAWKDKLHPNIVNEIINDLTGTDLERFLYCDT